MGPFLFLDTLVMPQADNSLSITVYCKPTHTDQYLQWNSHHNLFTKYSVIGTLTHRSKTVCTRPELFQKQLLHLKEALVKCKYPHWAINRKQRKYINGKQEDNININNLQDNNSNSTVSMDQANSIRDSKNNTTRHPQSKCKLRRCPPTRQKSIIGFVVIPYTHGIADSFKKICGKYGIQTYFKGNTTIKQLLMKPNDQDPKDKKSGVIYSYQCGDIACGYEYVRETSRTLRERYREHLKHPSPFHVHIKQTGHNSTANNFNIIGSKEQGLARTIKEAIYIRVNNPTLNRNIGKYNLNHIWDRVLFNSPALKLDSSQNQSHIHSNGQVQTNLANNQLHVVIGHSGACSEFRACAQRVLST